MTLLRSQQRANKLNNNITSFVNITKIMMQTITQILIQFENNRHLNALIITMHHYMKDYTRLSFYDKVCNIYIYIFTLGLFLHMKKKKKLNESCCLYGNIKWI